MTISKVLQKASDKISRKKAKGPSFEVCNWLCDNEGVATIGNLIDLVVKQQDIELSRELEPLFVELGAFLGLIGVCDITLSESNCSQETTAQFMTLGAHLVKCLLDVVQMCKTEEDLSVAETFVGALCDSKTCLHPYVAWEYFIRTVLLCPNHDKIRGKCYTLVEEMIAHFFDVHADHTLSSFVAKYPQIRLYKRPVNSPNTDSDSAFTARLSRFTFLI